MKVVFSSKNRHAATQLLRVGLLALSVAPAMAGQAAVAPALRFEVATVRPSKPDATNSSIDMDPGRFRTENVTIETLLKFATHPKDQSESPIVGAPAWVRSERYDINTKESEETTKLVEAMPPAARLAALQGMILALLEERFSLKFHMVQQDVPILVLSVAKGGSKMQTYVRPTGISAENWSGFHNDGQGHVEGRGATTAMLTDFISYQAEAANRVVVNQTGLGGEYTFTLRWAPANSSAAPEDSSLPSLTAAMRETLGLELKRGTGPVQAVNIDHIEKPSQN